MMAKNGLHEGSPSRKRALHDPLFDYRTDEGHGMTASPKGQGGKGLFEVLREEMKLRNYSHKTFTSYRSCLREFVKYFAPRHPRELSNEDIRKYLLYLIDLPPIYVPMVS